ncbi:MAG: hypothetical protein H7Y38_12140, partial [Armatimonadetes bacterium]|nr:hypothetical protein [Armatimonadota bacterium]
IITAQGGDQSVMDTPDAVLPFAPVQLPVVASRSGYVSAIAARRVGEIVVNLGGGRSRKEDAINPAVGVVLAVRVGDAVRTGNALATVHAATNSDAINAARELIEVFTISDVATSIPTLIRSVIREGV